MRKRSRLKPLSRKRASEKRDYTQACKEQDQQMMDEHGHIFCVSCEGEHGLPTGHSHNLPVAHFKHLESDPRNFKPRCDFCHKALDYPDFQEIIKFKDFHDLMAYRLEMDIHAFNRWVSALIAIGYTEYQYIEDENNNR
jgi:hypothetical protein